MADKVPGIGRCGLKVREFANFIRVLQKDAQTQTPTEVIRNVLEPAGIPAITGEEGLCSGCGIATLSIDYYDLGYETGLMAYEVLVEGKDISTMDIRFAPIVTKEYNAEMCEILGIEIPEGYVAIQ